MPIVKVCAMLLDRNGKVLHPADVKKRLKTDAIDPKVVKTNHISMDLRRLVDYGIAKRMARGKYVLANRELALQFLSGELTQHTQRRSSKAGTPPRAHGVMVRPHNVEYAGEVQNDPHMRAQHYGKHSVLNKWRRWDPNEWSTMFEKLVELEEGRMATVRYCHGHGKKKVRNVITIKFESLMIDGRDIQHHLDVCREAGQKILTELYSRDRIRCQRIKLSCREHFAIWLPLEWGHKLPGGQIPLGRDWWIDHSHGHLELETDVIDQMQLLIDTAHGFNSLEGDVKEKLDRVLQDNGEVLSVISRLEEILLKHREEKAPEEQLPPPEGDDWRHYIG